MRKGEEDSNATGREQIGSGRSREVNMATDVRIAMNDINRTMEKLRTGKITAQYGPLRSRPAKNEAWMNSILGICNQGCEKEGRKSHEKRKREKNNAQKGAKRGQMGRMKKFS